MHRILIIGASGFLGSQLKKRLDNDKKNIVFAPTHKELDALKYEEIEQFIRNNNVEIIVHAAANHAGVGAGVSRELFFLESNLIMNYNLVKAAYENGVAKFITFGTSCCYNDANKELFTEEDYWTNKSEISYGTCKRVLLEQLQLQDKMKWVYLIPPNLYGCGDHFGGKNLHFIPATFAKIEDAIATSSNKITVWGDGSQKRDFLYIEDLIDIVIESFDSMKYDNNIINISTMKDSSVKEIVELILEKWDKGDIQVVWDTTKPVGAHRKQLDNSKFLNISPNYNFTPIEDGIKEIVNWYSDIRGGIINGNI